MAIGGTYNANNNGNENNKKSVDNTYFSRIKIKNDEVKLSLSYKYNLGNLIVTASEIKDGFHYEELEAVWISPTKALLFSKEIDKFKEYLVGSKIEEKRAFGITTGMGEKVSYIGFSADKEKHIYLTLGKIDGSGNITNSVTVPFNYNYHYAIEWNNIDAMDLEKVQYEDVELTQFQNMVKDFARAMSGAYAYSVLDLGRYDIAGIKGKMDPIYEKLGIEKRSFNNNRNYGENNFLSNAKSTSSTSTTFDDIEASFED
jgi:hypothetical protein